MASKVIREYEIDSAALTAVYQELVPSGETKDLKNAIIRNTSVSRLRIRIDGDDDNSFTVSPGEKYIFGGFNQIENRLVEVRTETDIVNSVRIDLFG